MSFKISRRTCDGFHIIYGVCLSRKWAKQRHPLKSVEFIVFTGKSKYFECFIYCTKIGCFIILKNLLNFSWVTFVKWPNPEAATRGVLWKKVFLEISQNSKENSCTRASFLIKLQASGLFLQSTSGNCFCKSFFKSNKNKCLLQFREISNVANNHDWRG